MIAEDSQTAACGHKTHRVELSHQDGAQGRESAACERSALCEMGPGGRRRARLACTVALVASLAASAAHLGGVLDLGLDSGVAPFAATLAAAGLVWLGRVGVLKRA